MSRATASQPTNQLSAAQELEQTVEQVFTQALQHQQAERPDSAEELYRAILDIKPEHPDANHNLGVLIATLKNPEESLPYFKKALEADPACELYWVSYIDVLISVGQLELARQLLQLGKQHGLEGTEVADLEKRLALDQQTTQAQAAGPNRQDINRLTNLQRKGRSGPLEAFARELTQRYPRHGLGWKSLGIVLEQQSRIDEALQPMLTAVELLPDDPDSHNVLGVLLQKKARFDEATACFLRTLELKPEHPGALSNLGNLYRTQGRLVESEDCFRRALKELKNPLIYNNLGATLLEMGRIIEAEDCYRQALRIKPDLALGHINLGVSLRYQGRLTEAIDSQRKALELDPDCTEKFSNLLFTLNYSSAIGQEERLDEVRRFGSLVSKKASRPFSSWTTSSSPARLRVGLVSGDLYNHPVGFFLESLLGSFDRGRIELFAYTNNPKRDELTDRIRPYFQAWTPLYGLSDEDAARTIHKDGIHVLLDLSGHTTHNRLPLFAWKPAPVQASWLGYFATTGLPEMDYFIADETGVPEGRKDQFTESVWYLPETRLCFSPPAAAIEVSPPPALEKGHLTFGCFQKLTKIGDEVLELWGRIFTALPDARLRCQCTQLGDPKVAEEFVRRVQNHGIDPSRVSLHGAAPRGRYLSNHGEIDIILDTFPFPGGTTTCEALWMGVPTLTLAGDTLLSRQGASLLAAAGLEHWIAGDKEDYLAKAVSLSGNLQGLADLRHGLRQKVLASPLFDAPRFARNLENALFEMWENRSKQEISSTTDIKKGPEIPMTDTLQTKTFLHVGCGPQDKRHTTEGFNTEAWRELRLDINEAVQPDIVGTMTDMSRVEDASVDAIFSSHNIEHLYPHEVPVALGEFRRVLKEDGFAVITCPDLKSVCAMVAEDKLTDVAYQSPAGPISPIDILYGHRPAMAQGNLFMAHRCGFTEKVLRETLQRAGFPTVATMNRPGAFDLWAVASKSPRSDNDMRALAAEHFVRPARG